MKQITIAGNLGSDAELRDAQGKAVCSFSVAVSRGKEDPTTWFRCTLWEKRAEALAKYLTKGSKVTIVGDLSLREYTDKAGEKRSSLEVAVREIDLQGGGAGGGGGSRPAKGGDDDFGPPAGGDDDIPF